ncbi:hypothetical protein TanjilG_29843 [Lupinus angustifolius]|uniref:Fe2OG dioxygenase domain-containing protein n=1 Tax=Lupinus angustifolius TaxID=3871 RepID=A0A4P1RAD2_LUPAN|nr:PREDICTED: gibberellin 2-beta-dioxygenase 2-like [Lupinus angustifolius]OIW06087.1 hypothetical protein TanjilG_29843 [Lupinus angustifolius]
MRIPTIDLSMHRSELSKHVVKACEEYGFFKVVNHSVPKNVILRMEEESAEFFAKPSSEKCQVGPATPFGYGCRNIGLNGDMGNLEYLLLHTNPLSIFEGSKTIANDANKFSCAVNDYIKAAREVAAEILDLVAEGLCVPDKFSLSKLITDFNSDSVFRINHYPPLKQKNQLSKHNNIGFGEHSDPQILTILRSNNVSGLQIYNRNGFWIPVTSDPNAFFVIVGDSLQVSF